MLVLFRISSHMAKRVLDLILSPEDWAGKRKEVTISYSGEYRTHCLCADLTVRLAFPPRSVHLRQSLSKWSRISRFAKKLPRLQLMEWRRALRCLLLPFLLKSCGGEISVYHHSAPAG